jgi:hypothetical protein
MYIGFTDYLYLFDTETRPILLLDVRAKQIEESAMLAGSLGYPSIMLNEIWWNGGVLHSTFEASSENRAEG